MVNKKRIQDLIVCSVQEFNEQMPNEIKIEQSASATLFGKDGKLDSLGLVNLIVKIEQDIEDEFDVSITIADEKAMSQSRSPFRSIGALADYIYSIME